jgi:hypothetical protein
MMKVGFAAALVVNAGAFALSVLHADPKKDHCLASSESTDTCGSSHEAANGNN